MTRMFLGLMLKAMVPLFIVLGALAYVGYLQGGDPMAMLMAPFKGGGSATISRTQATDSPRLREGPLDTLDSTTTVYRWKDTDGNVHFSNRLPEGASGVESLEIDPDANLILGVEPSPGAPSGRPGTASDVISPAGPEAVGNPYSADGVQKLIDQAKQVQELVNQRFKQQEEMLQR